MRINVPQALRNHIPLPAVIDTATMSEEEINALYNELYFLRETEYVNVPQQDRPAFQTMITEITIALTDAVFGGDFAAAEIPASLTAVTLRPPSPKASAPATGTRRLNKHVSNVKNLRSNFGTGAHDQFHFAPTDAKKYHGVWSAAQLSQVKKWIGLALDSIYADDNYVVASKPGNKAGYYTYLVNMDTEVGYLSGSGVTGTKPSATHIEVYLDKKGITVSAFPSDPSIF